GDISKAFPAIGGLPRSLLGPSTTVQDIIDHVARTLAEPPLPSLSAALGAVASEGPELLPFAPVVVEAPLHQLVSAETNLPRSLLITRDAHGVADKLAELMRNSGHEVVFSGSAEGVIHLEGSVSEALRLARANGGMFVAVTFS